MRIKNSIALRFDVSLSKELFQASFKRFHLGLTGFTVKKQSVNESI